MNTNLPDATINLYERAFVTWGRALQEDVLIEECAELIQAIMHKKRDPIAPANRRKVTEELADVQIMLEEMLTACGYGGDFYDQIRRLKLERLERRLYDAYDAEETKA